MNFFSFHFHCSNKKLTGLISLSVLSVTSFSNWSHGAMRPTFQEYDLTSMRGEMHSKLIGYKRRQIVREPQRRPSSSPSLIPMMVTIIKHCMINWAYLFHYNSFQCQFETMGNSCFTRLPVNPIFIRNLTCRKLIFLWNLPLFRNPISYVSFFSP